MYPHLVLKALHGGSLTIDLLFPDRDAAIARCHYLANQEPAITACTVYEAIPAISVQQVWRWDQTHGEQSVPWDGSEGEA